MPTIPSTEEHHNPSFQKLLKACGNFVYQTPGIIQASLVCGVALAVLFPPLAPPFLGVAASTVLSRLVIKIMDSYNRLTLAKIKERVSNFHQQYSKVQYIAFLVALFAFAVNPFAGLLLSCGVGVYKGILVENTICKSKEQTRRENSDPLHLQRNEVVAV